MPKYHIYGINKTQPNTRVFPILTPGLISWFTWGLLPVYFWKMCPGGVYFWSTQGLLWAYPRFAFMVLLNSEIGNRLLSYYLTACNSHFLYFPNTLVVSASGVYFWMGFTGTLWVYFGFTWVLLWIHSSKPQKWTLSVRLGLYI